MVDLLWQSCLLVRREGITQKWHPPLLTQGDNVPNNHHSACVLDVDSTLHAGFLSPCSLPDAAADLLRGFMGVTSLLLPISKMRIMLLYVPCRTGSCEPLANGFKVC